MRIVFGSSSSFLCPPGHPNHYNHVEDGPEHNPNLIAGLDYVLQDEYDDVPKAIKARVQALFDNAELVCSELWQQNLYGYFKKAYSPDGVERNVTKAVFHSQDKVQPPPERHLAYLMVKQYFPDAEPRVDLIESGGFYGTKECLLCGTRLQYEARVDCFAEAITCKTECPKGDVHNVAW